tara:strand:+ start:34277 stop:34531 length:255 start_codon:yes stop_codon:yes gene_type:complete
MNRVWIELELGSITEMEERTESANKMMRKLNADHDVFWVNERRGVLEYCVYVDWNSGTYESLEDNGHWFKLDELSIEPDFQRQY